MSDPEGLRAELAELRAEVAGVRVLAAMADRDAAGIRGIIRGQNALHETQVEHTRALRRLADGVGALMTGAQRQEETLQGHGALLARLVDGQTALAATVARQDAALAEILRRLPRTR